MIYNKIASIIKIKDVQKKYGNDDIWISSSNIEKKLLKHSFSKDSFIPLIINNDKKVIGYIDISSLMNCGESISGLVLDYKTDFNEKQFVYSNDSILSLIKKFEEYPFFFVKNGKDISGYLNYEILDSIEVKLLIMSLFLDLENEINRILLKDPLCFGTIDDDQKLKKYEELVDIKWIIRNMEIEHFGYKYTRAVIATSFDKKSKIIHNFPHILKILEFVNEADAKDFLDVVRKYRNKIAHSDSIVDLVKMNNFGEISFFIDLLYNKVEKMKKYNLSKGFSEN